MLVIRLQRTGRANAPAYRIVVAEKARPVQGKFQEIVGHYLPTRDPKEFEFKQDRIEHWVSKGAVPSSTVARLLTKAGVQGLEKFMDRYVHKKPKKEPEEPKAPPPPAAEAAPVEADAPAEPAPEAEKPVEEPKASEEEAPSETQEVEKPDEEEKKDEPKEETSKEEEGDKGEEKA